MANKKRICYAAVMDEGRKRVIGIMAAILASLHMQTADDLFGGPQGTEPLSRPRVQSAVKDGEVKLPKLPTTPLRFVVWHTQVLMRYPVTDIAGRMLALRLRLDIHWKPLQHLLGQRLRLFQFVEKLFVLNRA